MKQQSIGHVPRKRFGQNFLQDANVIRRIVSCITPARGQVVLEVGPGQGALTQPLLDSGAHIVAVEIDRDLAAALRERHASTPHFTLREMDALQLDLGVVAAEVGTSQFRVVGNLPYNISTPLLFHLLQQRQYITDMHFMLQKEVVQRLAAEPGGKDYGRLSVMAQYYCHVSLLFDVPPGSFFPPPKVMSAIVRLQPRTPATLAKDEQLLSTLVNTAFQQRRKTLRNTLKTIASEAQILAANIKPDARAETLSVSDFVHLANILHGDIECPASASK